MKPEKAVFAAGCFWGVEEIFSDMEGVISTKVGYTGGNTPDPTYREVCTGLTGHAEAVEIEFDSDVISYENLLKIFWEIHDPTTLNRQGPDTGTQYRSAVFHVNEEQKSSAENMKNRLNEEKYNFRIVTEITPFGIFYPAEEYHQKYFKKNPGHGCSLKF
ncbi:MAG: peptide-methionine (S)-S-oxide reductase MsrA [Spirochaetes bacterium]|nr:peptide-methionine (S)-S-oxide reductase MsrA [Spirochaetota bacterium]